MSEPVVTEQPDLSALTGSGSPGSKRKRDPNSPTLQRAKRAAPPANMTVGDTAAYIESAIQATEAAAANGVTANGVNVADFNALQQAAQEGTEAADPGSATSTAQAALGMYPTLHIPPSTEEQFAAQAAAEASEHAHENPLGNPDVTQQPAQQQQPQQQGPHPQSHHPDGIVPDTPSAPVPSDQQLSSNGSGAPQRYSAGSPASSKPTVGSEEWHKMRKDNHKEVERRRRETINEGINELAKIVPGCEKNKGSILQRACHFITQLKENEQQNIEKWTLEKLLTEQAITELSTSNDKLKQECERLFRELETWKRVAQNAGLEAPQPGSAKEEPAAAAGAGNASNDQAAVQT